MRQRWRLKKLLGVVNLRNGGWGAWGKDAWVASLPENMIIHFMRWAFLEFHHPLFRDNDVGGGIFRKVTSPRSIELVESPPSTVAFSVCPLELGRSDTLLEIQLRKLSNCLSRMSCHLLLRNACEPNRSYAQVSDARNIACCFRVIRIIVVNYRTTTPGNYRQSLTDQIETEWPIRKLGELICQLIGTHELG